MHRKSGRYPNNEYYVEIMCLPDEQLFSPSEIARRKYNRTVNLESFQKMFHAIYQFGIRNGITLHPDNCLRRAGGKPFMEDGKAKLQPGERSAKWYGRTWKSKLYIEDRLAIKKFVVDKFINVLSQIQNEKAKGQPMEKTPLQKPTKKAKGKRKFSIWAFPLVAAILLTGFSLYNYSFLREGFQILRQEGAKSALAFFQTRGEGYDNIFGEAWASYRNGDYEQAEKLSQKVLKSSSMKDQARASYLLGELNTIEGAYEEAKEHLLTALTLYETLEKKESRYKTQLILAKMYLAQKDIHNASYYLNLSEQQNEKAWEDEYFLYFKSQVAFFKSDFDTALLLSLDREKLVNGDNSRLSGIYSDIGLYYGFTGNLDECLSYTVKAQGMASEQENKKNLMHNNLNMCLYLKCSMQDYSELRETILSYARSKKDMKLMEMMYFIEKFSCPITHGDPGDAPPPDGTETDNGDVPPPRANRGNQGNEPPPD